MTRALTEQEWWGAVRKLYQSSELGILETISQNTWLEMFENPKYTNTDLLMGKKELEYMRSITEPIHIYRGIGTDSQIDFDKYGYGFSWTTDIDRAKWFACRFNCVNKMLLKSVVLPQQIIAVFLDMDEKEIVVNPLTIIDNIKMEVIDEL